MNREAAWKFIGRVYRGAGPQGQGPEGDLQIGGRAGEGNCAGRLAGVFFRMRAQLRQEAENHDMGKGVRLHDLA